MAATVKIVTEVKGVKKVDGSGFLRDKLQVTAEDYNLRLQFEVPAHRASSYPIGRKLTIIVKAD